MEFVKRRARCDRYGLLVIFIAEQAIGEHGALVRAEALGDLARLVHGK